jgi:hypothetical protein
MFSGAAGLSLAGQMTEFLDTHPEVFKAMNDEPELLNIVTRYATELQPFLARYTENLAKKPETLSTVVQTVTTVWTDDNPKPAESGEGKAQPETAEPDEGMQAKLDAAMTLAAVREKTIESLTVQFHGAERLHAQSLESVKTQTARAEAAESALKAATDERDEAKRKLAAIEAGKPPASSEPVKETVKKPARIFNTGK